MHLSAKFISATAAMACLLLSSPASASKLGKVPASQDRLHILAQFSCSALVMFNSQPHENIEKDAFKKLAPSLRQMGAPYLALSSRTYRNDPKLPKLHTTWVQSVTFRCVTAGVKDPISVDDLKKAAMRWSDVAKMNPTNPEVLVWDCASMLPGYVMRNERVRMM